MGAEVLTVQVHPILLHIIKNMRKSSQSQKIEEQNFHFSAFILLILYSACKDYLLFDFHCKAMESVLSS